MMDRVVQLTARDSALVDTTAVHGLQRSMGIPRCQELVEETIYNITERLSKLARAMQCDDYDLARTHAQVLVKLTDQIGLLRMSIVSANLLDVLLRGDQTASHSVSARLVRLGEKSLFTLAEIGVEGI